MKVANNSAKVVIAWSLSGIWGALFELLETKDTGLLHAS